MRFFILTLAILNSLTWLGDSAVSYQLGFQDEKLVLWIVWYLGFFSLVCYKRQKEFSFFFLYFALYLLYFYCVYNVNISSILLSYIFYLSLFFLYHWYFTFTRRFILRSYSVVKVFFSSSSFVKLKYQ